MPFSSQPDPSLSARDRARHRIARRLLPFLFITYVANYMDRANVAYAALGMTRDLGFTDRVIGLGAGIFFLSYVVLQIPGALLVERWSARRLISIIMMAWGALSALTAAVQTAQHLYVARFVLGAAEATFFPGVIVYLAHWFIYEDRAKAVANFMAAIPVSLMIGSPIAGALLGVHWFNLAGWRWLFIMEGVPAVILGALAMLLLPDRPQSATWLPEDERAWIVDALEQGKQPARKNAVGIMQALRSRAVILLAMVVLCAYTGCYTFLFWFPTMLKRLTGFSDMQVGAWGAIPYVAGLIAMQLNGWHSDRTGERRWHAAIALFTGAIGMGSLAVSIGSFDLKLLFFTLMGIGFAAYLPVFWALPGAILSDSAAAAAVGFINSVGSTGGFLGPYAFGYLYTRTGSMTAGMAGIALCMLGATVFMLLCPERKPSPAFGTASEQAISSGFPDPGSDPA
jgi:ACS family tartrate transporter-like MFS transporter